jgi:hypothetical protein
MTKRAWEKRKGHWLRPFPQTDPPLLVKIKWPLQPFILSVIQIYVQPSILSTHPSFHPPIHPSIRPPIHPSTHPSFCPLIHPSVFPFAHLSNFYHVHNTKETLYWDVTSFPKLSYWLEHIGCVPVIRPPSSSMQYSSLYKHLGQSTHTDVLFFLSLAL